MRAIFRQETWFLLLTYVGVPMLVLCATFSLLVVYPLDRVAAENGERERYRKGKRARDRERERERERRKGVDSGRSGAGKRNTYGNQLANGQAEEDEVELAKLTFEGELKRRGSFGQLEFLSSPLPRAPGSTGRLQGSKNTLLIKRKEGSVATLVVHSPR